MASIAYKVLQMVSQVRRDPTMLSAWLDAIEKQARRSFDGAYVALMGPIVEDTWETSTTFPSIDDESPIAKVEFTAPIEIVGFFFSVVPASFAPAPPLVFATPFDLLVSIEIDKRTRLTSQDIDTTQAGGPESFVSMPSVDMRLSNRLIGKKVESPKPLVQFKWRWKQGPNVFVDSDVSAAIAWRFL